MVSDDRCECNVRKTTPLAIPPNWLCVLLWMLMGFIAVFIRKGVGGEIGLILVNEGLCYIHKPLKLYVVNEMIQQI